MRYQMSSVKAVGWSAMTKLTSYTEVKHVEASIEMDSKGGFKTFLVEHPRIM